MTRFKRFIRKGVESFQSSRLQEFVETPEKQIGGCNTTIRPTTVTGYAFQMF